MKDEKLCVKSKKLNGVKIQNMKILGLKMKIQFFFETHPKLGVHLLQLINCSVIAHTYNQVINHGVSKDLIDETMEVVKEFFSMPEEEKEIYYSIDPIKSCKLYTSGYNYANEDIHFWCDNLRHPCHPLDEWVHLWPEKPTNYQ
ncbi:putative hyoscyamine (6S)-dioxygenase [Helianthus anomalus]